MRLLKAIALGRMWKDAMANVLERVQPLFTAWQVRVMSAENMLPP